jgi:tyrosine-protein kinase Etk/Wzc
MENENLIPVRLNYLRVIQILLSRWYWIIGFMLFFFLLGYLYLTLTKPLYTAEASLKFDEKKSELTELINVRNLYDRTNKVESEKSVIRSRAVILKAKTSMDYDVSFFMKERFMTSNLYPSKPLSIDIISEQSTKFPSGLFVFTFLNEHEYSLTYQVEKVVVSKQYSYGQTVSLPGFKFRINALHGSHKRPEACYFSFNDPHDFFLKIKQSLKIDDTQNLNVLNLKIADQNPYFAADVLNAIIAAYLTFDKAQRSVSATQTTIFIDTLLQNMSSHLKTSSLAIEKFKEEKQLFEISGDAKTIIEELTKLEADKHALDLQSRLVKILLSDTKNGNSPDLNTLNANLQGVTDPQLNSLIIVFNDLLNQRKDDLETYKISSGHIREVDQKIASCRTAIHQNLHAQLKKNSSMMDYAIRNIAEVKSVLKALPKTEQKLINLQSAFNVNQKVHGYLSEKKLESQISKASVIPGAIILDSAIPNLTPISPISKNVYTIFVLLGFLTGIGIIFLKRHLNPYIFTREVIEELTKMPILGMIGKMPENEESEDNLHVLENPRSSFSESLRSVRTNLSFLASDKKSKIICITSEISGEGKSFTAINLAAALSVIEKKVVLVLTDLRKSENQTIGISSKNGLSNYLSAQSTLEEILIYSKVKNLTIIPSGPIPPNPSELLHGIKMKDLLINLKERFDYVILDTAPIGLVSDALPVLRLADINLFIIRYGISSRYAAILPDKITKEFGLSNSAIVMNGFENNNLYSQYYSAKKPHYSYRKKDFEAYQDSEFKLNKNKSISKPMKFLRSNFQKNV